MLAPCRRAAALLCAVVKADGYGHGAIAVSEAALDGRSRLAGGRPRRGGRRAAQGRHPGPDPPAVRSPASTDLAAVVRYDLRVTVHSSTAAERWRWPRRDQGKVARVHLKVDTGMNRVGVAPEDAVAVAREIERRPELELEGVFTHCAVADEPDNPFTDVQLDRFEAVLDQLADAGHLAAAAPRGQLGHRDRRTRRGRYDLVRCRHRRLRHRAGSGPGRPSSACGRR